MCPPPQKKIIYQFAIVAQLSDVAPWPFVISPVQSSFFWHVWEMHDL